MTVAKTSNGGGIVLKVVIGLVTLAIAATCGTLYAMHGRVTRVETLNEAVDRRLTSIEADVKTLLQRVPAKP